MNSQIDNLVKYFFKTFDENTAKETNFSKQIKQINQKALDIKEDEFKKLVGQFVGWVSPVDLLIMSINAIERIKKQTSLKNCNRFTILWIMCVLSAKYLSSHDHESELSIELLSNLGGFQLNDYIYFEKILLKNLDWKLEISDSDYQRLIVISRQNQPVIGTSLLLKPNQPNQNQPKHPSVITI